MVVFYSSVPALADGQEVNKPTVIYMGKDKVENEDLIKYGFEEDIWFHVDKLSSAHVYLRMQEGMEWDKLDTELLNDCAQLVKANSIEGNKKDNIQIIYTPWSNLNKKGDMPVGAVSFHDNKKVKRVYVKSRDNAIVNRLEKTKKILDVDHIAAKDERLREIGRAKRAAAIERKKMELSAKRARDESNKLKNYDNIWTQEDRDALEEQDPATMEDDFW